jgi:hypothetical protein
MYLVTTDNTQTTVPTIDGALVLARMYHEIGHNLVLIEPDTVGKDAFVADTDNPNGLWRQGGIMGMLMDNAEDDRE